MEKLINELPETIFFKGTRAFLEITKSHVYYCTNHNNRGICNCVFVSVGKGLEGNLMAAQEWISSGKTSGEIIVVN